MSQAKYSLGQRLFAEWLGSMLLVVAAISPTILGFNALKSGVPLAVVMDAFAVWLVLFVLITILGPVSYCHINPSVTIAMMATKNIGVKIGVLYIIVQLIGGLCGTLASHAMFIGNDFFQWIAISTNVRSGGVYFAEFLGTFMLNLTIFGLMHHKTEQAHRRLCHCFDSGRAFADDLQHHVRQSPGDFRPHLHLGHCRRTPLRCRRVHCGADCRGTDGSRSFQDFIQRTPGQNGIEVGKGSGSWQSGWTPGKSRTAIGLWGDELTITLH